MKLDLVVYGATGFTGRQCAAYIADHAPEGLRWAVAGRDVAALEEVADESGAAAVVVADSNDAPSVDRMCAGTRVLMTTAGPYSKYGSPVVECCVRHATAYVDITGETPWVRAMIDRHHETAASRGVRLTPFCGFDSIPSDLGTLLLVEHFRERGLTTRSVDSTFRIRAGLNGGTLDSMLTIAERGEARRLGDPTFLQPAATRSPGHRVPGSDRHVSRDPVRDVWRTPFVMAPINTQVVRRSWGLSVEYGASYGDDFVYTEAMEVADPVRAVVAAGVGGALAVALRIGPGRDLVRMLGPEPGEGPSRSRREQGFFRTRLVGEAHDGSRAMATLAFDGDPSNAATVTMVCESALLVATAADSLPGAPDRGGLLTPAASLGLPLVGRLRAAGMRVRVEDLE